jgi:protein-arginine kinase activator protein McsA
VVVYAPKTYHYNPNRTFFEQKDTKLVKDSVICGECVIKFDFKIQTEPIPKEAKDGFVAPVCKFCDTVWTGTEEEKQCRWTYANITKDGWLNAGFESCFDSSNIIAVDPITKKIGGPLEKFGFICDPCIKKKLAAGELLDCGD